MVYNSHHDLSTDSTVIPIEIYKVLISMLTVVPRSDAFIYTKGMVKQYAGVKVDDELLSHFDIYKGKFKVYVYGWFDSHKYELHWIDIAPEQDW